ncbi:MAG: hypothetical protein RMJ28_01890 [Nitrososphaerota archaeon]|nr:hypothetical protein [Candidatus Calditenuaceae archaeon]MDW8072974.1 hypothetical protein [Nitrososphaerota archaeon]
MEVEKCRHEEVEFLGSQRTEGGLNLYFRCKRCGDVIIVLPDGKRGFVVRGLKPNAGR